VLDAELGFHIDREIAENVGVGATTAIVSVVRGVLLRELPFGSSRS